MPEDKERFVRWVAKEFEYHKKDLTWYAVVAFIGLILIAIAFWQNNLLFAICVVLAVVMIMVWGQQRPAKIKCRLDDEGLEINDKFYEMKSFAGYYLDDEKLALRNSRRFGTYLKVMIDARDKQAINEILKDHLKEIDYQESLTEEVADKLKF